MGEAHSSPFSALRIRDYRFFWLTFILTCVSNTAQAFGIGWLVVQLAADTGRPDMGPFYLGLVGLARAIPAIGFGLFGGVVADRADRRTLLIATQAASAALAFTLAALCLTERATIPSILLLAGLISATSAFYVPTRQAIQPRLVGEHNLMSAIGLNTTVLNVAALVAPLAAGQIITRSGVGTLMAACGACYIAVAVALLPIERYPPLHVVQRAGVLRSLAEGLAYIRDDQVVRWLLIVFGCATVLARPYLDLLPAVASDTLHVGPVELSWMVSAAGVGALVGGFTVALLGAVRRKGLIVLATTLLAGAALAIAALQRAVGPMLPLLVLTGFALMLSAGTVGTIIQTTTPDHLRGRVISVQSLLVDGGLSSGALLLGSLGSVIGISPALTVGGLVLVLSASFVMIRAPALTLAGARRVPDTTVV